MNPDAPANDFRVIERDGPAARLILRGNGDPATVLVLGGYRGPVLPEMLTSATIAPSLEPGRHDAWRLSSREGIYDFEARVVDRLREWPGLLARLHEPFALRRIDRLAARLLLALMRFPGGARLMRKWHARRGH